jgi:hypothetical protein
MKENELVHLKKELKSLQEEKDGLLKVKNNQIKALEYLRNDEEYNTKV